MGAIQHGMHDNSMSLGSLFGTALGIRFWPVCCVCCGSGWSSCGMQWCSRVNECPCQASHYPLIPIYFSGKKLNSARITDSIFGSHFHDKVNIWPSPPPHFDFGSCIFKQPHKHLLWTSDNFSRQALIQYSRWAGWVGNHLNIMEKMQKKKKM